MKKFIAFVAVCTFAIAIVSCGGKTETTESTADSVATEPAPAPATVDTVASDTTGAAADSVAN